MEEGKYTQGTKVYFITRYDINSGVASDPREGEYQERVTGWIADPRCKVIVKDGDGNVTETVTVPESRVFATVSELLVFLQEVMQKNVSSCWTMYNRYTASREKAEHSKEVFAQYKSLLGTGESVQDVCDRILRRNIDDPFGLGTDVLKTMERELENQSLTYTPYTSADTLWDLPPRTDVREYVTVSDDVVGSYYIAYENSKIQPQHEVPVKITGAYSSSNVDTGVMESWESAVSNYPERYASTTDVFIKATLVKSDITVYFVRDVHGGFYSIPSTDSSSTSTCRLDLTGSLARAEKWMILSGDTYVTEDSYYSWVNTDMTEEDIVIHYLPFTTYSSYHPTWVTEAVEEYVKNSTDVSTELKNYFP